MTLLIISLFISLLGLSNVCHVTTSISQKNFHRKKKRKKSIWKKSNNHLKCSFSFPERFLKAFFSLAVIFHSVSSNNVILPIISHCISRLFPVSFSMRVVSSFNRLMCGILALALAKKGFHRLKKEKRSLLASFKSL